MPSYENAVTVIGGQVFTEEVPDRIKMIVAGRRLNHLDVGGGRNPYALRQSLSVSIHCLFAEADDPDFCIDQSQIVSVRLSDDRLDSGANIREVEMRTSIVIQIRITDDDVNLNAGAVLLRPGKIRQRNGERLRQSDACRGGMDRQVRQEQTVWSLHRIIARCFGGIDGNCISYMNSCVAWALRDNNGASLILNPEPHSENIGICDFAFKMDGASNREFLKFLNGIGLGEMEPAPQGESKNPGAKESTRDRNRS